MIRLGLCCIFREAPIKFRTTTASSLSRLPRAEQLNKLNRLCMNNAESLLIAIKTCADNGIGAFRINSKILPLKTHPAVGYGMAELPDCDAIIECFKKADTMRRKLDVRLSFHPDQFVLLNSPRTDVVESSLKELAYQAEVSEWVGADVLNIHGGGAYGDKTTALARLIDSLQALPASIKTRLTLENDDRIFTPADLLPVCRKTGIPLVYDAHHHRCLPDGLSEEEATDAALATWNREPLFHISSPRDGWNKTADSKPHADFITPSDFPACWEQLNITVEVEAKAKEPAVADLRKALLSKRLKVWPESTS